MTMNMILTILLFENKFIYWRKQYKYNIKTWPAKQAEI